MRLVVSIPLVPSKANGADSGKIVPAAYMGVGCGPGGARAAAVDTVSAEAVAGAAGCVRVLAMAAGARAAGARRVEGPRGVVARRQVLEFVNGFFSSSSLFVSDSLSFSFTFSLLSL